MKPNTLKMMLICTNSLKIWHSENLHPHICAATETVNIFFSRLQDVLYLSYLSHPSCLLSFLSNLHLGVTCLSSVRPWLSDSSYPSLPPTPNVWDSQSQPEIRWMGLTDHKGFRWTVKQGNAPVSRKKELDGLRHPIASYCGELDCIISSNQMRISRRKINVT